MTLRLKSRKLGLARKAYRLVCFKADVGDARIIEADYRAALLEAYIDWVRALAKALQKTLDKDLRKIIVVASIEKIIGILKKLGREYLTKSFEVGTGRKSLREKQWEPDDEMLDAMLEEAIEENDSYLDASLMMALYGTSEALFEKPEEFETQAPIREQLLTRAYQVGLYASAAWTLFWKGDVGSKPPGTAFIWKGSDDDALCPGCEPRLEQVYTQAMLPGFPGDGSTPCEMNCRCWLEEATLQPYMVIDPEGHLHSEYMDDLEGYSVPSGHWAKVKEVRIRSGPPGYGALKGYYNPAEPGILNVSPFVARLGGAAGTTTHELGHLVYREMLAGTEQAGIGVVYQSFMGRLGTRIDIGDWEARDNWAFEANFTEYGLKNEHEFFAEGYRLYAGGIDFSENIPGLWETLEKLWPQ